MTEKKKSILSLSNHLSIYLSLCQAQTGPDHESLKLMEQETLLDGAAVSLPPHSPQEELQQVAE